MTRVRVAVIGKFAYDVSLERYLLIGFETLGCEVFRSQGPVEGVDLTVAIKCDWLNPTQMSGTTVLWWTDSTVRFPAFSGLAPKYDRAYLIHDEHLPNPAGGEYPYLPCGYCPATYNKSIRAKTTWDVSFIGTHRPEREWIRDTFYRLSMEGVRCGLFGSGWGPNVERLDLDKALQVLAGSKICLNWSYPLDSVNMRQMEVMGGLGMFLLSDPSPGLKELGLDAGQHYATIAPKTAEYDIKKWLKRPIRRRIIAQRGWEAARGETYAKRCQQILKDAGLR